MRQGQIRLFHYVQQHVNVLPKVSALNPPARPLLIRQIKPGKLKRSRL